MREINERNLESGGEIDATARYAQRVCDSCPHEGAQSCKGGAEELAGYFAKYRLVFENWNSCPFQP